MKQRSGDLFPRKKLNVSTKLNRYGWFTILSMALSIQISAGEADKVPFNGDFEVGTAGYETVRIVRPDTNPKLEYTPLQTDGKVKRTGSFSLRLDNPHAEQTELHSSEFILKAGRTYVVSGYIKSDLPNGLPVVAALEHYSFKHQNLNVRKELSVGSAWQPFSFELKTKDFDAFFHLIFTLKSGTAAIIWLDDLKVVEKSKAPTVQAEAGIYADRKLFLGSGQTAAITIKLHNPTRQAINRPLRLIAIDDYFNTSYPIAAIPVSVEPGATRDYAVRWPLPRFGAYRLELADSPDIRYFPGYLVNINKVEPVKYSNNEFMPGFNTGLPLVGPNRAKHTGWEVSGQSPEEFIRVLSAAGCRIIRGHNNSSYWYDIEPEPGKFDLSWLEQSLGLYEKNNIAYMPVLVAVCSERQGGWEKRAMRDWQKQLSRTGKDWLQRGKYYYPPLKNWCAYVQVLAERFKDRVPTWEIINEPQFIMSADEYMQYLSSASEVLRRIKPDAYLVGICSTSDYGADIGKFATEIMKKRGLEYLDAVSFHPYASRELTSSSPADRQIATFKENVDRFKKKPIWEGELFYLFDGPTMQEWYRSGRFEAHHLAQRYIIDCGEGCAQSHPVSTTGQLWKRMLIPNYEGSQCHEANPSSGLVAFSTISELLTSAAPICKNKRNGVVIYGFRHRNGKLFAAVWKYSPAEGLKIDLKDFAGKDFFGNPLEKKVYLMSPAPFYLFQDQYSETEFMNKLNNLKISYDNPVTMIPVIRLAEENNKLKALVTLVNHGNQESSGAIGLKGACKNHTPFSFKIGPQKTESYMIDVVRGEGKTTTVSLYVNGNLKTLTIPTVDIKLAEAGKTFKLFSADKKLFGTGRFTVNVDKITIELNVLDKTIASPNPGLEAWQQDGIEFFVDPEPYALNSDSAGSYTPNIFRFFVFPRLPEPQQFKVWKNNLEITQKDFSCRVIPGETGYQVILSMDLKKLHLKENALGIEIKISDAEGTQPPPRTIFFSGGNAEPYKNRSGFGIFKFLTLTNDKGEK